MRILSTAVLIILIGCNSQEEKENHSMPGAYKMLYQKVKGGTTDTTFTSLLQQKIFTDDYMMYANFNTTDSASSFGVGTYTMTADSVAEKVFYTGSDSTKSETLRNYNLVIEKSAVGYKQIIPEIESQGEKFILTEDYENIGKAATSSIDGLWKLEKVYHIKGMDTATNDVTQYKIYHAGHFIWGQNYADSAGKNHTAVGFGTFEMSGNGKLKEFVFTSTYPDIRKKDVDITVEMNGDDGYTQTIMGTDSSRNIEMYKRIKK